MSEDNSGTRPLRLGSVTIRNVTALQAELAERLDDSGPLRIDGSGAERADTAMIQLLVALVRDARADGRKVEWVGCSAFLQRAVSSLGLESALGLSLNTI